VRRLLALPLAAALLAAGGCGEAEKDPQASEATIERFILKQEREEAAEKASAVDEAVVREQQRASEDRRLLRKAEQDAAADKQPQRR
jgi:serine phosphatase RsbU (regulator of sigma subunit)